MKYKNEIPKKVYDAIYKYEQGKTSNKNGRQVTAVL